MAWMDTISKRTTSSLSRIDDVYSPRKCRPSLFNAHGGRLGTWVEFQLPNPFSPSPHPSLLNARP